MFDDTVNGGCLDLPESTDYSAKDILGADNGNLPDKFKMSTLADDQGNSVKCTCYTAYHAGRILNEIEHKQKLKGLPDIGWTLQQQFGTFTKNGDSLQTGCKSIKKNGLHCDPTNYPILNYAKIEHSEIRSWLARGYPIITCADVTKTNFKDAKFKGVWGGADGEKVTAHAFALTGYETGHLWALNSYGATWGFFKDGTFKIKDTDVAHLGSCYILYDAEDVEMIFRDVSEKAPFAEDIRWVLEKGLMKGYDSEKIENPKDRFFCPEKPVTRAELAAVLHNYFKNI